MGRIVPPVVLLILSLSAPANGQDIDSQFQADVEKLIEVTGAGRIGAQMASLVSRRLIDNVRKAQPNIPERAIMIISEVLDSEYSEAFTAPDGLRAKLVGIYARHFTHEDVLALLAFYNTDVGRKLVSALPALAQEGAAAGQEWAAGNMPRIAALMEERLRAEGFTK